MKILDRLISKFWRSIILPNARIRICDVTFRLLRLQNNNFCRSDFLSEFWMINVLKSINNRSKLNTFLDIGVNIGQILLKIKAVN